MTGDGGWTFEYVPGAGDDEESWARGLTPQLLWAHKQARLCSEASHLRALELPPVSSLPISVAFPSNWGMLHRLRCCWFIKRRLPLHVYLRLQHACNKRLIIINEPFNKFLFSRVQLSLARC